MYLLIAYCGLLRVSILHESWASFLIQRSYMQVLMWAIEDGPMVAQWPMHDFSQLYFSIARNHPWQHLLRGVLYILPAYVSASVGIRGYTV